MAFLIALLGCTSPPVWPLSPEVELRPGVPWSLPARPRFGARLPTVAPEDAGLDPEALAAFDAYAFARPEHDPERRFQRTDAVVILRHGAVVYERYDRGTTEETPLLTWSVTKSFSAAVVGAAVHEGRIDVNEPICRYFSRLCRDGKDAIRLTDALRMSSGLEWRETYETSPVFSSVMAMLYTRGRADMAGYVATKPLVAAPGTRWLYSSGDSMLVSAALAGALGERYADYPFEAVADRIGMEGVVYERDGVGIHVASSYLYTTARGLARLGQLLLDDGMWNGERILAEGWTRYLTTLAPAFGTTPVTVEHHMHNPGAHWYVNVGDPERGLERPWPALPPDAFGASGHWGKAMWVIPSWDMVVVRLGDDRRYGCSYPVQPDCEPDTSSPVFTKAVFLEKLAAAVRPHAAPSVEEP